VHPDDDRWDVAHRLGRQNRAAQEGTCLFSFNEQALVSLKLKKLVDAGVGRTFAVIIEGGSMAK